MTLALPVQNPPSVANACPIAAVIISIFSTCNTVPSPITNKFWIRGSNDEKGSQEKNTGTLQYSVRPLPVLPSTPNELLSSNKTRKRYFSFSRIISSRGAIWPEF